jgi:hypothetical protein
MHVHDSVERLDPHWVNVSVQDYPFRSLCCQVGLVSHYDRKETVLPLSGGRIDDAVQFIVGDRLKGRLTVELVFLQLDSFVTLGFKSLKIGFFFWFW